ncbi:hypothetical protein PDE_02627 [Penicillium oxalicum 114-2]|uniref:Uncharacterized protein n=1 Tax=Penicillium oxalicum (strain 114-2 / CGMCC 5302) TaxID=933388 RepID=S8AP31_PENO1|nr:hypothetical protein PDE_02627 [Penicillium oxalicum 114-2]
MYISAYPRVHTGRYLMPSYPNWIDWLQGCGLMGLKRGPRGQSGRTEWTDWRVSVTERKCESAVPDRLTNVGAGSIIVHSMLGYHPYIYVEEDSTVIQGKFVVMIESMSQM